MKSTILTSLVILFCISCKKREIEPLDLAHKIQEKYEGSQSLSYEIDYRINSIHKD